MNNEKILDQAYWDLQYKTNKTGWDLGIVSPAIEAFVATLENKNLRILIPGCGNSYEAEYLLNSGFTDITLIDIAPRLVHNLRERFQNNPNIKIVLGDFFDHQGQYDLIIEQTFFCALQPKLREKYVLKMHQLLSDTGKLAGLLFNKTFEFGPPFGGSYKEYQLLFDNHFEILHMDLCKNSIKPRANSELFFEFRKK